MQSSAARNVGLIKGATGNAAACIAAARISPSVKIIAACGTGRAACPSCNYLGFLDQNWYRDGHGSSLADAAMRLDQRREPLEDCPNLS